MTRYADPKAKPSKRVDQPKNQRASQRSASPSKRSTHKKAGFIKNRFDRLKITLKKIGIKFFLGVSALGLILPGPTQRAIEWGKEKARSELNHYLTTHGIDLDDVQSQALSDLSSQGAGIALLAYIAFGDLQSEDKKTGKTALTIESKKTSNNQVKLERIKNPFS